MHEDLVVEGLRTSFPHELQQSTGVGRHGGVDVYLVRGNDVGTSAAKETKDSQNAFHKLNTELQI